MNRTIRAASRSARFLMTGLALLVLLATRLPAAEDQSEKEVSQLIEKLGDPNYAVRDWAQEELERLGGKAYDALTFAVNNPDLEIAARARYLLLTIQLPVVRETESDRVKEILEGYSDLSTAEQLDQVQRLMVLPAGEGYHAACRLVHIEKSLPMSKFIATGIFNLWPIHAQGRKRMGEAVDAELKRSGRLPSQWLRTYAVLVADPLSGLKAWRETVEKEELACRLDPAKSGSRVAAAMLYDLAYWESQHGDPESAQQHFQSAQQVQLAPLSSVIYFYLDTANFYRNRGRIDWAVDVYGLVSKMGYAQAVPLVQRQLAEMLHDAGRHTEAAAALDVILELLTARELQNLDYVRDTPERVRARKHFFLACQARTDGDDEKYRRELAEALDNDPNELDALIARFQIPNLDDEIRLKTIEMIDQAALQLREDAETSPDDPSTHNEFAWLVGNTTGDMQEALRHAQRAVELSPESGAYFDTLAHVYFYGLKDYDKAVESQEKAIMFTPNSGLIRKKYELFRKAAAERNARPAENAPAEGDRS